MAAHSLGGDSYPPATERDRHRRDSPLIAFPSRLPPRGPGCWGGFFRDSSGPGGRGGPLALASLTSASSPTCSLPHRRLRVRRSRSSEPWGKIAPRNGREEVIGLSLFLGSGHTQRGVSRRLARLGPPPRLRPSDAHDSAHRGQHVVISLPGCLIRHGKQSRCHVPEVNSTGARSLDNSRISYSDRPMARRTRSSRSPSGLTRTGGAPIFHGAVIRHRGRRVGTARPRRSTVSQPPIDSSRA